MSLHVLANQMASRGRGGDSMLVHMTPGEVAGLQALAMKHGGSLSVNPETGLVEAGFLKKLLPMIAGAALNFFAPGVGTAIGGALGLSGAAGAGIAVGGLEALRTGSLSKGLMAGLGAYGGAGLTNAFTGAGTGALASGAFGNEALTAAGYTPELAAGTPLSEASSLAQGAASQAPLTDKLAAGFNAVKDNPMAFAKDNWKYGLAAAAPIIADEMVPTTVKAPAAAPGYIRPFQFNENTRTVAAQTPVLASEWGARGFPDYIRMGQTAAPTGMAKGGIVALAEGGGFFGDKTYVGGSTNAEETVSKAIQQALADQQAHQQAQQQMQQRARAGLYDRYNTLSGQSKAAYDYLMGNTQSSTGGLPVTGTGAGAGAGTPTSTGTPTQTLPVTSSEVSVPGGGGGFDGGGGGLDAGGVGDSGGPSIGTSGGLSGTSIGNSGIGAAIGAIANAAEGVSLANMNANNNVAMVDMSQMSQEAQNEANVDAGNVVAADAAAAAANAAANTSGDAVAADAAAAAAADAGVAAADGVGSSGMGVGDGGGGGSSSGDGGGGGCVDPAVLITLADGNYVPAGSIKVGDVIFAMHEKTLEFGAYPVEYVEELDQPKALVLFDDGSSMLVSHSHKFFMVGGEWKQVYQLEPGDTVKAAPGTTDKTVIGLDPKGDGPVMKFTVTDAHTYISDGLISHNSKAKGGIVHYMASGGMLPRYALGGLGSLGGYSDGGRLLKGPGDGVSDSIPATIGRKQQPARLADGEFVIPARIVSELGNGSTDAGARKLYAMMDRIQKNRSKTVGKGKVAANSRAYKHLPA